jgi:hypothetical protein
MTTPVASMVSPLANGTNGNGTFAIYVPGSLTSQGFSGFNNYQGCPVASTIPSASNPATKFSDMIDNLYKFQVEFAICVRQAPAETVMAMVVDATVNLQTGSPAVATTLNSGSSTPCF